MTHFIVFFRSLALILGGQLGIVNYNFRLAVDETTDYLNVGYGAITISEVSSYGYSCVIAKSADGNLKVISDPWNMIGSIIEIPSHAWASIKIKNIKQDAVQGGRRFCVTNIKLVE